MFREALKQRLYRDAANHFRSNGVEEQVVRKRSQFPECGCEDVVEVFVAKSTDDLMIIDSTQNTIAELCHAISAENMSTIVG